MPDTSTRLAKCNANFWTN